MAAIGMLQPLLLTLMGAAGTGLGGLLVVLQPQMSFVRLGALQGLAAGLMLSISLMDLLPEAAEEIGFIPANICFYLGVLLFAAIVALIPEPDAGVAASPSGAQQPLLAGGDKQHSGQPQALASYTPPAAAAALQAVQPAASLRRRSNTAAAAALDRSCPGYMPAEGMPAQQQQQQQQLDPSSPGASSCAGSTDLQVLLSEEAAGGSSKEEEAKHRRQLLMSALITAVGIALHNFPEGIAVLLAAQKSTAVGVSLACAIALHNIPEGVAVALPVYFATGSRWRGLQTAVLSGLAEPLAVILLGVALPYMQLNKHVVDGMLAGVGGIMAFLSFHELLPLALQHAGKPLAVGCFFVGMGLMSVTLHVLNTYMADLH